jgi:hypothetical protein
MLRSVEALSSSVCVDIGFIEFLPNFARHVGKFIRHIAIFLCVQRIDNTAYGKRGFTGPRRAPSFVSEVNCS